MSRPLTSLAAASLCAVIAFGTGCFGQGEGTVSAGKRGGETTPEAPTSGEGETPLPPFEPARLSIRKLLGWQYQASVHALLGPEAALVAIPPPDAAVNGFDAIGAAQLSLSTSAIDRYERSAHAAVKAALAVPARRAQLIPCTPESLEDSACLGEVVSRFGRRAFRRQLTDEELSRWVAIGKQAAVAYDDFARGAGFALAGMLQSPQFLYLVEVGEPDPEDPTRARLTGLELASRLSYFLTGAPPDEELLNAAEEGALHTDDGLRAQARRLLSLPEARAALDRFFDEALELREVTHVVKDPARFPEFSGALAQSMREETRRVLGHVVWERDSDFREVFDAPWTFVNADLAALYGVADAAAAAGAGAGPSGAFVKVALPPSGTTARRGGILGHAGFLSLMAHPRDTSPTLRGKFIRERLLCKTIPAPPDDIDATLPPTAGEGPKTMREKLAIHRENPSCAGCHALMDDVGLGLENFDAIGRYRETDEGLAIDAQSHFDDRGAFAGPRALGSLLKEDERVLSCLVRNAFRMATGHVDTTGETAPLHRAERAFAESGYRLQALLVELVASDAFRYGALNPEVTP